MQYVLTLNKTTKNTHRYDNRFEDADLRTVYVQKTMFPVGPPEFITVTVEASDVRA